VACIFEMPAMGLVIKPKANRAKCNKQHQHKKILLIIFPAFYVNK
jgi:hypothetical protein